MPVEEKDSTPAPEEGALRVWWIPQVPMEEIFYASVGSPQEAARLIEILAAYDIFQFEQKIKPDYSNAGGLEVFEDGEWTEWYDDMGRDIDDAFPEVA